MSHRNYIIICVSVVYLKLTTQTSEDKATGKITSNFTYEIYDLEKMLTLDAIKAKLKESEIFDYNDPNLSANEKEELEQLFDHIEIVMTARMRQPANAQRTFATIEEVHRIINSQVKLGRVSITLANRFQWHKQSLHKEQHRPAYRLDEENKMRIFYTDD